MPRWLVVALTLIVYAAAMTGLALVVRATVPTVDAWLVSMTGEAGAWALMLAILIPAAIYGWWPRKPDGTMRRLRSPWD
ncbi:hypothetical protein [Methylobacterium sp. Leaf456]|uniref:hypothetical protein n=1 Tax=Methylobacterium sp. Leaf456 TaxID=1736382 RepID=UPI0012E389CC|nr:hypothetical protein [Methylobacterium sp. Leaf456]